MGYNDAKPAQLGSSWVESHKQDPAKIEEARKAGALSDLLTGQDPDRTCAACGGTGKAAK